MDLTTLATAFFMVIGLLGTDVVMHGNSVVVEVIAPPKTEKFVLDQTTIEDEFEDQLFAIAKVQSVVTPPEIRASRDQGLGMTIAKEVKLQDIAYALQSQLGYNPDRLRFALFLEDGAIRGRVSGSSRRVGSFRQTLVPHKDESLISFIHRCALWGASQLAPYATALYLLQRHSPDGDFADVVDLIEHAKSKLPTAPVQFDRSALDNLLGIVALFKHDPKAAHALFERSMAAFPEAPVPVLNAAFADLQLDDNKTAAERMRRLIRDAPPANKVLLATAYTTWGAAEMGLRDLDLADQLLSKAHDIDPDSSTALDLWAETKTMKGEHITAADLRRQVQQSSETFENYAEVAALYFRLAWQDNMPVTRSTFTNPSIVTFH